MIRNVFFIILTSTVLSAVSNYEAKVIRDTCSKRALDEDMINSWTTVQRHKRNIFECEFLVNLLGNEPGISLYMEPLNSQLEDRDHPYN